MKAKKLIYAKIRIASGRRMGKTNCLKSPFSRIIIRGINIGEKILIYQ